MATEHELYCDESHAARQRCNRALAPEPDPPAALGADEFVRPPVAESPAVEAVEPSRVLREVVAAAAMPSASPYATRAWEETARAVGAGEYVEPAIEDCSSSSGRGSIVRSVAVAFGGVIVVALIVRALRGKAGTDELVPAIDRAQQAAPLPAD